MKDIITKMMYVGVMFMLTLTYANNELKAQCFASFPYGTTTAPTVVGQTNTLTPTCAFGNEYGTITGATAGHLYQFTATASAPVYVTVTQGTPTGTVLVHGFSPVEATPTVSGNLYMHYHSSAACATTGLGCVNGSITLLSTAPPCSYDVPANIVVNNDPGQCGAVVTFTVGQGNCPDPPIVEPPSGSFFPVGETVVEVGTGTGGYTEFTVTVLNTEPPTLECPNDIVLTLGPGACSAFVSYDITYGGACPPLIGGLIDGFNGPWDISNWTEGPLGPGASFDYSNLPDEITLVGPDGGFGCPPTMLSIEIDQDDTEITFDWEFNTVDAAFWDPPGYSVNGVFTVLLAGFVQFGTGTVTLTLNAGDVFAFEQQTLDCFGGPGLLTIRNFQGFAEVPAEPYLVGGIDSGGEFPIGVTRVEWESEDGEGGFINCDFDVVVNEFPNPTLTLVCNNLVNVSVDENCEALINADMILEGGPYRCYDNYEIVIETLGGLPVSNPITSQYVGENLVVSIVDPETGNSCWGYLLIEDKTIPNLECGVHTVGCDDELNPGSAFTEQVFLTASHNLDDIVFGTAVACNIEPYSYVRVIDLVANGITSDFTPETFWMGVESAVGNVPVTLRFYVFDDPSQYDPTAISFSFANLTQIGGDVTGTIPPTNLDFWQMDIDGIEIPGGNQYLVWDLEAPPSGTAGWVMGSNTGGEDTPTYIRQCGFPDPTTLASIGFPGNWISGVFGEVTGGLPFPVGEDAVINPPSGLGPFTVTNWDACGPATLTFEDEIENFECDDDFASIINRHWVAVDGSGNTSECTQIIQVQHGNLSDYEAPPTWYADCSDNFDLDSNGNPHPSESGSPINDACKNIVGTYTDVRIDDACGGYKILRKWTLLDWCTLEILELEQILKVVNDEAPEFVNCPDPGTVVTVGTRFNDCVGDYIAQQLTAINNCTGEEITDVVVTASAGTVVWNQQIQRYQVLNLPVGQHTITYTVNDGCDNIAQCTYILNVIDDVPPIAICDERTRVSLGSNGEALVHVSAWDDGSYDNCGIASILAYRKGIRHLFPAATTPCHQGNQNPDRNDPRPQIKFCCADIGEVEIVVEVTDVSGNMNICWVVVEVEDKLPPVVSCPADVVIDCKYDFGIPLDVLSDDELNDLLDAEFGGPISIDNCELESEDWLIQFDLYHPHCQIGTAVPPVVNPPMAPYTAFRRVFIAEDVAGNQGTCIQDIVILPNTEDPFIGDDLPWPQGDIRWPEDETVGACLSADDDALSPEALGSEPFLREKGCSRPVASYEDQVFTFVEDACFKILRTWTVIDWCNHNANTGQGEWSYIQTIQVQDDGPSTCNNCEDQVFVDSTSSDCNGFADLILDVNDCTPDDLLQVTYEIDLFQTGIVDIVGSGLDASGFYPFGVHAVKWTVNDLCSNTVIFEYNFEIVDAKIPSPVCLNGIATVVMPVSGDITIPAAFFDAASFDNCTANEDLIFTYSADVEDLTQTWTCEDLDGNNEQTFEVEVWVTDEAGNQDFCITYILIQDNNNICPDTAGGTAAISGFIANELDEGVSNVEMNISGTDNFFNAFAFNEQNGFYEMDVFIGQSYEIAGSRNDNPLNGVTTFDIALIQRHILGTQFLNNPYKLIAADVNNDGKINVLDIAELRRVILGTYSKFPNNDSWKIIVDEPLQMGVTPPAHQTVLDLGYVIRDMEETNFIGVKIGDVNASHNASGLISSSERSLAEDLRLQTKDRQIRAGEQVVMEITSDNIDGVFGYQGTINFDATVLEFVNYEAGVIGLSDANFGFHLMSEGMITTSWSEVEAVSGSNGEVLFAMIFEAKQDGTLSDLVEFTSARTASESYNERGVMGVEMVFGNRVSTTDFALYQNSPNPFNGQTVIGFVLPEATEATMTIYDVTGKVVRVIEGDYTAGYNELTLERRDVGSTGVYYYQLDTDNHTATKKMIFMD